MKGQRKKLVIEALGEAQVLIEQERWAGAWEKLAEAHIYSQPVALLHAYVHWRMLKLGFQIKDASEVWGQILRLLLAVPGSLTGRYPKGNTGRSNVSAFVEMKVPDRIRERLKLAENAHSGDSSKESDG